jgi:hypothetical protein
LLSLEFGAAVFGVVEGGGDGGLDGPGNPRLVLGAGQVVLPVWRPQLVVVGTMHMLPISGPAA